MIQPLPPHGGPVHNKINEVIETVNALTGALGAEPALRIDYDRLHELMKSSSVPEAKSSGFRPLHIEDGQVQEATPSFRVFEDGVRWTNTPPVPEAEPQEQEQEEVFMQRDLTFLRDVVLAKWAKHVPILEPADMEAYRSLCSRIRTATHREYAQPEKADVWIGTSSGEDVALCFRDGKYYHAGTNTEFLAVQLGKGV